MRKINIITFVLIMATVPMGLVLPEWVFWENNWIENIQAIVLFGAFLMNLKWAFTVDGIVETNQVTRGVAKLMDIGDIVKSVFISEAVLFLVAFGREISWGRVFYVQSWGANGPEFPGIKEVWFGPYLPWVLGIAAIVLVYNLWKSRQLIKHFFCEYKSDHLLRLYLIFFVLGLVLSETVFEKSWISVLEAYHQNFEELFELIGYWSAFAVSYRVKELLRRYGG